jgi:acetyl-CoA acetyltransferase
MTAADDIVIVGAAESSRLGTVPELSSFGLHAEASASALADAGVRPGEVDGIATQDPLVHEVAHYLGLSPAWMDGTLAGGCSSLMHVRHAAGALRAGLCTIALVTHGQSGRSRHGTQSRTVHSDAMVRQFEHPSGATAPMSSFTVPALRFMASRGLGQHDLAEVVVAQRRWANPNPRALRRKLVSVRDVLESPAVAYPFTRDMCCPRTDGGGALVLMTRARARTRGIDGRAVRVLGAAEALETSLVSQLADLTTFRAFEAAGRAALAEAGLSTRDIDHLMVYDAFAHLPLYGLETLAFVPAGGSGEFIRDGQTGIGGSLPMNTNGGGLCYTHTGMYGMFAIQESVRQLRGEAVVQAGEINVSLVLGVGMMFAAAACLVLARG